MQFCKGYLRLRFVIPAAAAAAAAAAVGVNADRHFNSFGGALSHMADRIDGRIPETGGVIYLSDFSEKHNLQAFIAPSAGGEENLKKEITVCTTDGEHQDFRVVEFQGNTHAIPSTASAFNLAQSFFLSDEGTPDSVGRLYAQVDGTYVQMPVGLDTPKLDC